MTIEDGDQPDGTFLYFSYGANMEVEGLRAHCPSAAFISIARLADHRLAFSIESKRSWLGGVCDVLPDPGDEVWGAVWRIPQAESHALDDHEGLFREPPAYRRYPVDVTTPDGRALRCRSYRVATPDPDGFAPSRTYHETILRGARAIGLPPQYVARLEAIADNGRTVDRTG